jgi:hypothetical protein
MVDYQAVKSFFETKSLSYYTFYSEVEKAIKAVIRHPPTHKHPYGGHSQWAGGTRF